MIFPKFPGKFPILSLPILLQRGLSQDYPGLKKVLYFPLLGGFTSIDSAQWIPLRTWLWLNDSDAALQLTTASGSMAGMPGERSDSVSESFGFEPAKSIQLSVKNSSANPKLGSEHLQLNIAESLRNFGWSAGHLWWLCGLAGFTLVACSSPVLSCHRSFLIRFAQGLGWGSVR